MINLTTHTAGCQPQNKKNYLTKFVILAALDEINGLRTYKEYLQLKDFQRGEFTLSQLPDVLNYKLQDISNKKRFIHERYKIYKNSIFFEHMGGEKFRRKSWRKILINYKDNAKAVLYTIPDVSGLTARAFMDICIGICIGSEMSNETAAKLFKCTTRRIQAATARNNKAGFIIKQARRKIQFFDTKESAEKAKQGCNDLGIYTSRVFQYKRGFGLFVGHTNSYKIMFSRRYKGKILRRIKTSQASVFVSAQLDAKLHATIGKWTRPAFTGSSNKYAKKDFERKYRAKFLEFNTKVYSLQDFANKYREVYA